jgi:hypothetical protein
LGSRIKASPASIRTSPQVAHCAGAEGVGDVGVRCGQFDQDRIKFGQRDAEAAALDRKPKLQEAVLLEPRDLIDGQVIVFLACDSRGPDGPEKRAPAQ